MLDPKRIGLNAESIGFQKRMRQDVDYDAFQVALQTDYNNQGSAVQVRREKATPVNEIHVMGGERSGIQSNDLIKTLARQERQINGYPLRHFDASNPAVILPKKYGGFPLYNRNQTEYPELVSVFTEPMSAPLQRNTELLGRMGAIAISNSLNTPYEEEGFVNPMQRSYDSLQQNQNEFKQRRHLQMMSQKSASQKFNVPRGPTGIFISKNGQPMSGISDQITDSLVQSNAFSETNKAFLTLVAMQQAHYGGEAGQIQTDGNSNSLGLYSSNVRQKVVAATSNDRTPNLASVEDIDEHDNAYLTAPPGLRFAYGTSMNRDMYNPASTGRSTLQPKSLFEPEESTQSPIHITEKYGGSSGTPTIDFFTRRDAFSASKGGASRQQQVQGYVTRQARINRAATPKTGFKTPKKVVLPGGSNIHTLQTLAGTLEEAKGQTVKRKNKK